MHKTCKESLQSLPYTQAVKF